VRPKCPEEDEDNCGEGETKDETESQAAVFQEYSGKPHSYHVSPCWY